MIAMILLRNKKTKQRIHLALNLTPVDIIELIPFQESL